MEKENERNGKSFANSSQKKKNGIKIIKLEMKISLQVTQGEQIQIKNMLNSTEKKAGKHPRERKFDL